MRAAHAHNPFDSLPDEIVNIIILEVFKSVPELATIPLDELMETLAQWNRKGKGRIANVLRNTPKSDDSPNYKRMRLDAMHGHPHALYQLALTQCTPTQYPQAVQNISLAANQGHLEAQVLTW